MRWIYLAIVVVFVAALIIFVFQNTRASAYPSSRWQSALPLALLVFIAYVLGSGDRRQPVRALRRSVAGSWPTRA